MWGIVFSVLSLCSLLFYLYGVLITVTVIEKNSCQMTYMFEYPQFVKIYFKENDNFPKYNLFAYSEGRLTEHARNMHFNGAPVIFVPGNSGSFKQVRSFASVALRKGIENNFAPHLDYFTIDYNEEYSALFGGFLTDQSEYLIHCITSVLSLYKQLPMKPTSVVLIGHSMGGKIAQYAMTHPNVTGLVNTLIMLGTPSETPVLNIDFYFETFYRHIDNYWTLHRNAMNIMQNDTNSCCDNIIANENAAVSNIDHEQFLLSDVLLINIGGGSRDVIVHSGLTWSKFSDIHAISTSIPMVWLTTDHLCSVWCLQQVLVINRFLYNIIAPVKHQQHGQYFIADKSIRMAKAHQHFKEHDTNVVKNNVTLVTKEADLGDWIEDSRRVFTENFPHGVTKIRYQMIRLIDSPQHEILNVLAVNLQSDDWIFGCAALEIHNHMRYCLQASSLSNKTRKIPSKIDRQTLELNLLDIRENHPTWTHILLRILPTTKAVQLNIDIHSQSDRELMLKMPKWFSYSSINLVSDTTLGSSKYTVKVIGMEESYQALELLIETQKCSKKEYHCAAKMCVPWTYGFDRYHHFTEIEKQPMYIYAPLNKPSGYNTSLNPILVDLHLDPNCRYSISIKNSFGMTLARIVQQFTQWMPAHLVAILLLALKHQFSLTPKLEPFKCGSLNVALLNCSSFFIITASRVFTKIVLWAQFLPLPDSFEHSLLISFIVHGSALAILSLVAGFIWMEITFLGKITSKILYRVLKLHTHAVSAITTAMLKQFPITAGGLLLSIAMSFCGGVSLIVAVVIYFILLSKMYSNYLEKLEQIPTESISEEVISEPKADVADIDDDIVAINEIISGDKIKDKSTENNEQNIEEETLEKAIELTNDDGEVLHDEDDSLLSVEEQEANAALEKLLKETMERQKKGQLPKLNEDSVKTKEYQSIKMESNQINFHFTLFILLVILAILNVPSVIAWGKNFEYSRTLNADPSLIPAAAVLVSLTILWQLETPKNIHGYAVLSSFFYVIAVIAILYCQESVYRLNTLISTTFISVTLHQLLTPVVAVPSVEMKPIKI